MLSVGSGCGEPEVVEVQPDFDSLIQFQPPVYYRVKGGDTINEIATAHGVDPTDVRMWNGIEGDLIEVDDTLLLWDLTEPTSQPVPRPMPSPRPARRVAVHQAPTPPPAIPPALPTPVAAAPPVPVAPATPAPTTTAPPRERIRIDITETAGVGSSGIMSALRGNNIRQALSNRIDAASAAAGLKRASHEIGNDLRLGDRTAPVGTAAETLDYVQQGHIESPGDWAAMTAQFKIAHGKVSPASLPRPAAKACKSGPTDFAGEGMAAATGLTAGQVQMTMTPFIRYTTRCIPRGSTGRAQITTSLTVGCNGRVISATVIDSGGLPPAVTQCIATTLKSAPFPAHDMPAGYVFQYPIHYSF